jgi:hypothetical protein
MGEVYRARDVRLGRDVAVKVLRQRDVPSDVSVKRFEQEARAASVLNHPNIVAVYDLGWTDGVPYIVTELLAGRTLAELEMPVPVRNALELALQVAAGLADAHEHGIVHRDIKPPNLFVTTAGPLKILDFGVAKLARESWSENEGPVTEPGLIIGTAGYMSPEQARGAVVDHRTDQFSLGCVLYELLTGEPPFRRGSAVQTLAALIHDEPAPLAKVDPRLPLDVLWLVERCLAKDPADRYFSTRDLARDLQLAIVRQTTPDRDAAARRPRLGRWRGAILALGAALVAAALVARPWRLRASTHSRGDSAGAGASAPQRFVVQHSLQCLDVPSASTASNVAIQQYPCHEGGNQLMRLLDRGGGWYEIRPASSDGKCLEVAGASFAANSPVQQSTCNGDKHQLWALREMNNSFFELVNSNSHLCMDIVGASNAVHAGLQQFPCTGNPNQLFQLDVRPENED